MLIRVLLILDRVELERRLDRIFEPLETAVAAAPRKAVLWDRVKAFPADLVVIDRSSLASPIEDTVQTIQSLPERPEVIVVSDEEDADERARLLIAGCAAVLNASLDDDVLREAFESFVTRQRNTSIERLQLELDRPRPRLSDFESVSSTMQSFLRIVRRVVEPNSSLLIQGETGVGKERLARAIHAASPRASGPFVPVILSAYPESLLEGELFGYEKGAFTGAAMTRRGCFELAHGGTLFLDEIGELPQHIQVKLLRILQDHTVQRLGSEETIRVDVRIMAATNRDLQEEIKSGSFRRDLYYRLGVVTLEVPPLREHPEDIPKLAERYLADFRVTINNAIEGFTDEAIRALTHYSWPGNVRELVNVVERAVLLSEARRITADDLPRTIVPAPRRDFGKRTALDLLFEEDWRSQDWKYVRDAVIRICEQTYISEQLRATGGSLDETASRAGINPRSLYDLMKRHGMTKGDFR